MTGADFRYQWTRKEAIWWAWFGEIRESREITSELTRQQQKCYPDEEGCRFQKAFDEHAVVLWKSSIDLREKLVLLLIFEIAPFTRVAHSESQGVGGFRVESDF